MYVSLGVDLGVSSVHEINPGVAKRADRKWFERLVGCEVRYGLISLTGFQSSRKMLRHTFPCRLMFGWYIFVVHSTCNVDKVSRTDIGHHTRGPTNEVATRLNMRTGASA